MAMIQMHRQRAVSESGQQISHITRQRRNEPIPVPISPARSPNDLARSKPAQQHALAEGLDQFRQTHVGTETAAGAFEHDDGLQKHGKSRRQRDVIAADNLDQ